MLTIPEHLPAVSVIVPTHNRGAVLQRTLDALCAQTYPAEHTELIVVADGCTDETLQMLQGAHAPFPLHVIAQSHQGPGAARNAGAARARGTILLFLDDDIEATPHLVQAHVRAHAEGSDALVIGYLPPVLDAQIGLFRVSLRRWWEAKFDAMRQPGHRFHAFDLLSGNVSLHAGLFRRVGGFDADLRCHEDYELGVRLIRSGVRFVFAPDAAGYHHERTDLRRAFERKFEEGRADVVLGRRYPAVRPALPLSRVRPLRSRRLRLMSHLAHTWPAAGDLLASGGLAVLAVLDRVRMRYRWRRLLDQLLGYWYWRGIADAVGSPQELARLLESAPIEEDGVHDEIEIDLRNGVAAAEELLDARRPEGARLRYGPHLIGRILPQPGAERLRGPHLRPILGTHLAKPLLKTFAQEGVIGQPFDADRLLALCAIPLDSSIPGIEPA